ncbi:MAG: hypothetical protein LQ350_006856 [Teloschistes chrysophthalmus]|nr:MAG: hypothetical protein LQ350_006856 [Niorma chrysophthalma]
MNRSSSSPSAMREKANLIDIEARYEKAHPTNSNPIGETLDAGITHTERGLKARHAQMIAIGGTIGTGLFVGSGQALSLGGPLLLLLSYTIISCLVYGIVTATTEMSSYLPIQGANMSYYGSRFFSRSLGFAMGWMYWYVFSITVPAEVTATSLVIGYWNPPVHVAVWITLTIIVVVGLNCFPVKVYGEAEFWFASLKVFGIIGLLLMALVLVCGGGPSGHALGFHYWHHPGPMKEFPVDGVGGGIGRLRAFVATMTFSIFAFAFAPELLVVTGGEMENPRRNLPIAGRTYFYRLILFYVLGVFAIDLIVSSNNENLLSGKSGAGSSPWAVAIREAGIKGLDSVVNAIIVTSAWSAANSRTLYSLALVGNAPRIFARCNRYGVPYYALAASASLSLLAYLNVASAGVTVFNWFVNLINTGGFQSWICVSVIYLRFRKATDIQHITDLPFRSKFQPYVSYICIFMFTVLMLLSGFKVFLPGGWNSSTFLTSYIGIPIFFGFYVVHKVMVGRADKWCVSAEEMDLVTGLKELMEEEEPVVHGGEKWWKKWRTVVT